jgi:hypothetical protein
MKAAPFICNGLSQHAATPEETEQLVVKKYHLMKYIKWYKMVQ